MDKSEIKVVDKPRIGILATGNELAEIGSQPSEKQIFETNRIMLSAMCCELDAEPLDLGLAKDDVDEIAERITMGLKVADAVITTGGTSVGGLDLVPEAVNKIGKPGVIVHGIAMRPAMPTALAVVENKPVMILSGNPVAAIIGFEVFARPLICKMLGMKREEARPTRQSCHDPKSHNCTRKKNLRQGQRSQEKRRLLRGASQRTRLRSHLNNDKRQRLRNSSRKPGRPSGRRTSNSPIFGEIEEE